MPDSEFEGLRVLIANEKRERLELLAHFAAWSPGSRSANALHSARLTAPVEPGEPCS